MFHTHAPSLKNFISKRSWTATGSIVQAEFSSALSSALSSARAFGAEFHVGMMDGRLSVVGRNRASARRRAIAWRRIDGKFQEEISQWNK
jgi:hypothetical protein